MSALPTLDAVRAALATVEDPEIRKPITELGMVETAAVDADGLATATILLTVSGCPMKDTLTTDTTKALAAIDGVTDVKVTLGVMNDEQRAEHDEQYHDPVDHHAAEAPHEARVLRCVR